MVLTHIKRRLKGGRKSKIRRKKMKGGGCACASPIVGGRRRRKSRRKRRSRYNKTKQRRRRNRSRKSRRTRRRRRQRGGACAKWGCDSPRNMGEIYTGVKNNTNPILPDPKSLNSNLRIKPSMKLQKGGGIPELMHDFGLGDLVLNYWKGTNTVQNIKHRYQGGKAEVGADPMNQPKLLKDLPMPYETANLPNIYSSASQEAAGNTLKQS